MDVKMDLSVTVKDSVTAEEYASKDSDVTTSRTKYSVQGFTLVNGTTDKKLEVDDMALAKDILLVCDQEITVNLDGVTIYSITNEEQTSTAVDRVSVDSIINSVSGVWEATSGYLIGTVAFNGSGLDDAISGGTYSGTGTKTYQVMIDTSGTPDTFSWTDDGITWTTGVSITGGAQALSDGVTITFAATTGHTLNDYWTFFVSRTGTNYFTGGSFNFREISLGTNLPGTTTDVVVDYTTSSAIPMTEKFLIQGSSTKSLYVTNNSGNTANLYIIIAGD